MLSVPQARLSYSQAENDLVIRLNHVSAQTLEGWCPIQSSFAQALMTDPMSPISDFYPLSFVLDAEGKRQEWEAVVVLEFISVPRLRAAEASISADQLTEAEWRRNQFGQLLHFFYDAGGLPCI